MRHARGKTIGETENQMITNVAMNTAEGHFNEHLMKSSTLRASVWASAAVTISDVHRASAAGYGRERACGAGHDGIRFASPVFHGDTLYCYTEVLEKTRCRPGRRRHRALQALRREPGRKHVFEGERTVLIKRRSHWGDR